MLKRSRLEAELRTLEAQQRQHETRIKAFIKEEEREKALTEAWSEGASELMACRISKRSVEEHRLWFT